MEIAPKSKPLPKHFSGYSPASCEHAVTVVFLFLNQPSQSDRATLGLHQQRIQKYPTQTSGCDPQPTSSVDLRTQQQFHLNRTSLTASRHSQVSIPVLRCHRRGHSPAQINASALSRGRHI